MRDDDSEIPLGVEGTVKKLYVALREIKDEYRSQSTAGQPWLIGFSGGKDSTLVLQLVMEAMLELAPSQRTRPVVVVSNDTRVESPVVQDFVNTTLQRVADGASAMRLPLTVVQTRPSDFDGFWINVIGRGYPMPSRDFRWCTDRLKIRPAGAIMQGYVQKHGGCVLLLGVRRSESAARAKSVAKHDGTNGERLNPHGSVRGCMVYRPIVEFTTEEVWEVLMQRRPPWGGTHRPLITLRVHRGNHYDIEHVFLAESVLARMPASDAAWLRAYERTSGDYISINKTEKDAKPIDGDDIARAVRARIESVETRAGRQRVQARVAQIASEAERVPVFARKGQAS